jgi:hypothetical protein
MRSKFVWALASLAVCVSTTVSHAADRKRKKIIDFAFHEFDANKDNKLSEKEFVGIKTGEAKEAARRKFKSLDKNGDSILSPSEHKKPKSFLWPDRHP